MKAFLTVEVRWWFWTYLWMVWLVARMTGARPDEEKVAYWLCKAIKFKDVTP
jgi:hypothetical protein